MKTHYMICLIVSLICAITAVAQSLGNHGRHQGTGPGPSTSTQTSGSTGSGNKSGTPPPKSSFGLQTTGSVDRAAEQKKISDANKHKSVSRDSIKRQSGGSAPVAGSQSSANSGNKSGGNEGRNSSFGTDTRKSVDVNVERKNIRDSGKHKTVVQEGSARRGAETARHSQAPIGERPPGNHPTRAESRPDHGCPERIDHRKRRSVENRAKIRAVI